MLGGEGAWSVWFQFWTPMYSLAVAVTTLQQADTPSWCTSMRP